MRFLLSLVLACLFGALQPLHGQSSTDPGDLFVNAYMAVQQGEKAEQAGSFKTALSKFRYAAEVLDTIAVKFPTWQPPIVNYRKQRTGEAIVRMQEKVAKFGPGRSAPVEGGTGLDGGPLPTTDENFAPPPEPDGDPAGEMAAVPPARSLPRKSQPPRAVEADPTADLEGAISRMKKLQTDLRDANSAADRAEREKKELVRKYEEAIQARDNSEKQQKVLQTRADGAEERLLKAQSEIKVDVEKIRALQTEASDAKRALRTSKIDQDAEAEIRSQLDDRLKASQLKIASLTEQRNALDKMNKDAPQKVKELEGQLEKARVENKDLATKLADTKNQLSTVMVQRDEAVKQLAQLKEAQKNVDKLVSDNAMLMAKLADTEKSVANFRAEGEEKDRQISALKKEVGSVKEQLAMARTESANYQKQMGDLQAKLAEQGKQLAQVRAENVAGTAERKKMQVENDILRGIVLRQQKQEAVRAATKKLVLNELGKLEINSKTLLKEIDFLSQPVVKLTPKELGLFKKPSLQVSNDEISANITKPEEPAPEDAKVEEASPAPATIPDAPKTAGAAPMVELKQPEIAVTPKIEQPEPAKTTEPTPEKPPLSFEAPPKPGEMEIASAKPTMPSLPSGKSPTVPKTDELPTKGQDEKPVPAETLGSVAGQPNIPAEFLPLARDGKDLFEKTDYRGAEKVYEKILAKVPNNLYILSNLGVVRFRAGKLKSAEEVLIKATKVAPEDGFSHCTLGIVYYTGQKLDEAVSELTKALAINPKNATAHNYLGITAAGKGWQEAAQKELETATTLDPGYADAHFNLAVVFATQTPPNKENARKFYKRATELGAEADSALEQLIK